MEYIFKVFDEINQKNAKRIIKDLKPDMTDFELETRLYQLIKADLISLGETNFD